MPGAQQVHGFLFADLRGYTADAESRGDDWAAELLDRYRATVREILAELDGAEIRTEGDSFYVVFGSASQAVAAGLEIVARCAAATAADPERPIRVGVGIHAGEAAERADGYIGTAVNTAARVCAQAGAGEVLVTDVVRGLIRTSGRYRFTPRGRPTLKGLAEPIALYRVEPDLGETAVTAGRVTPRRPAMVGGGVPVLVAAVLIVTIGVALAMAWNIGLGAAGVSPRPGSPASTALAQASGPAGSPLGAVASNGTPRPSDPQASEGPQPLKLGLLEPGTYTTTIMQPGFSFTAGDGWNVTTELPNYIEMETFGDDSQQLAFMSPSVGFAPCTADELVTVPARREDLVAWLSANPGLDVKMAGAVVLGTTEAQELVIGLGDRCTTGLGEQPLFQVGTFANANQNPEVAWVITAGPPDPTYLIDADGTTLVVLTDAPAAKMDAFQRRVKEVLSSLEVDG